MSGSSLGAILALHGRKAIVFEAGTRPKFAVGKVKYAGAILTLQKRLGFRQPRHVNLSKLPNRVTTDLQKRLGFCQPRHGRVSRG